MKLAKTFIIALVVASLFVVSCVHEPSQTENVVANLIKGFFSGTSEIVVSKWPDFKGEFVSMCEIANNFATSDNIDVTSVGNGVIILIESINNRLKLYPDTDILNILSNYLPVIQTVLESFLDKQFAVENPALVKLYAGAIRDGIDEGLSRATVPTIREKASTDKLNDWLKRWNEVSKK